jgi:hypothetical protein
MTCGSCEKLIERVAQQNGANIREIDAKTGVVALSCEEGTLEGLKKQLAEKGFSERAGDAAPRGNPSRVKAYLSSIIAGEPHVEVESRLVNYALGSTAALVMLGGIGYAAALPSFSSLPAYMPLLVLAILTAVMTVFSYLHMSSYGKGISCNNGMMVGMTMGMISGFMVGALIGATNGMFIGSVAGMGAGIALGGNLGRCCGVMGAMEGVMAGLMAGIMGAMTSIMMLRENLVLFLYILFGACAFVLGGLSYMMYRESGAAPKESLGTGFAGFAGTCALFAIALSLMMVYGPKGVLVYP